MKHLGLRNAYESTRRLIVGTIDETSDTPIDPINGRAHIKKMRDIFKAKREKIDSVQTLSVFPKDPPDSIKLYPNAYDPAHPPVKCQVDAESLSEWCRPENTPGARLERNDQRQ